MPCLHCNTPHPVSAACGADAAAHGPSLAGLRVGALTLVQRLGEGALGAVYLARQPPPGPDVVVRVLHPHLAESPAVVSRFYQVAQALRLVRHPHVVRVLDVRRAEGGQHCLVMERVAGRPLSQLRAPLPVPLAVTLLSQALLGLEAAHAQGLVHRDLTPASLLVHLPPAGAPAAAPSLKVVDFGLACALGAGVTPGAPPAVVGSPDYMAPEQWRGEAPDARADLYALGVVGYQLLTGRLPFADGRMAEALLGRAGAAVVHAHALNPEVPPAVSAVLAHALAPHADDRFQSADAFRRALQLAARPLPARVPATPAADVADPATDGRPAARTAPAGLGVRVHGLHPERAMPVTALDVTPEGLFVCWAATPPALAAQLQLQLTHGGRGAHARADVTRHVSREEARAWGVPPGFFLQLCDGEGEARALLLRALTPPPPPRVAPLAPPSRAVAAAPPAPPPDAEAAALLAHAAQAGADPYALLDTPAHADFAEVQRRADAAARTARALAARPLPPDQAHALARHLRALEAARAQLGDPARRAALDAQRGNLVGVARCLSAGIPLHTLASLRLAFLAERPGAEDAARALVQQASFLEAQGAVLGACERLAAALRLDPLQPDVQRRYWALSRRAAPLPPPPVNR